MRYLFNGKIGKEGEIHTIRVPFNLWEVCHERGVIKADLAVDNKIFDCELIPEDKGNYILHIKDGNFNGSGEEQVNGILLHVTENLLPMEINSPYSLEKPIRVIDSMEVINQPQDGLCGQTCVAMLAGVTIADVMQSMECREWQANMRMVISGLNYYGIGHSDTIIFTQGKDVVLPKCCVMMEKMGRFCHYLIHYDGKFYDPNFEVFEEYDLSKLLGYMEVSCI